MRVSYLLIVAGVAGLIGALAIGQQSIVDTAHNLSAGSAGSVRATSEEQICIFCHTPHNAAPIQPLWNRYMPVAAYSVYTSNALDAQPGQPTGSSKMCLSCHDGTIAVGSVISRDQVIQMANGITTLPPGSSNIGTDLADDHPISFAYDTMLMAKDRHLRDPSSLPEEFKLDENNELQCTTCHDAHDDTFGHFLVASNDNSALCRSCHKIVMTTITEHQDCRACHQTHTAPSGPYLLQGDRITNTCLNCHDGSHTQAPNIEADLMKISVHDTNSVVDPVDPIPSHVTCADCHDPHTMMPGSVNAPAIHPNFGRVDGINASGAPVALASAEYEVCFKCHADDSVFTTPPYINRVIPQTNTRLEFSLSAISSHPVMGPGQNPNVPSLKPGWTESSVMYCSDCHGSETSALGGGSGPNGVHGSNEMPLLLGRYETADYTPESASAYELCYNCHYRDGQNGILSDRSFEHDKHLGEDITCSACHDPHGISSHQGTQTNNSHLINFDTSIVFPDPDTGWLKYESTGLFSGRCYLTCHGEKHSFEDYEQ